MRLWHYKLIPVLPDKQLKAMRYEIGDMIKQYPNIKNGLVKYANNYSIQYLGSYFYKVCMEYQKRKIKCSDNYNLSILYIIDEKITPYELQYTTDEYTKLTYPEHNDRYLKQCYYNLQEKYDRGIISREEYKPIYDLYVGR